MISVTNGECHLEDVDTTKETQEATVREDDEILVPSTSQNLLQPFVVLLFLLKAHHNFDVNTLTVHEQLMNIVVNVI